LCVHLRRRRQPAVPVITAVIHRLKLRRTELAPKRRSGTGTGGKAARLRVARAGYTCVRLNAGCPWVVRRVGACRRGDVVPPLSHDGTIRVFRLCPWPVVSRNSVAFRRHALRIDSPCPHGCPTARLCIRGGWVVLKVVLVRIEPEALVRWIALWSAVQSIAGIPGLVVYTVPTTAGRVVGARHVDTLAGGVCRSLPGIGTVRDLGHGTLRRSSLSRLAD
jgi:hypothetical protein